MKIKSFKLVNNGTKGSIVTYVENKEVNEMTFANGFQERHMAPVPIEVKQEIDSLKIYFLNITGHWKNGYDQFVDFDSLRLIKFEKGEKPSDSYFEMRKLLDRVDMGEVFYDGVTMQLSGTLNTFLGNTKVKMKTPMIKAEYEFKYFEECATILKQVFNMVKRYVAGDLKIEPTQYVMDLYKEQGKTEVESKELLSHMSNDEKYAFMKEALEASGAVVLENMDSLIPMDDKEIEIIEPVSKKKKGTIKAESLDAETIEELKEQEFEDQATLANAIYDEDGFEMEEEGFGDEVEVADKTKKVTMKVA